MALSAVLKREGHTCGVVIDDLEYEGIHAVLFAKPDIVAFSVTTAEYPWMKQAGTGLRKRFSGLMICGGPHPTFFPDVIRDNYLDAICIGEGDEALPEFVRTLQLNKPADAVCNFIVKSDGRLIKNKLRPLVRDLDGLPFYDREIYKKYPVFRKRGHDLLYQHVVITGRGCPYKCTFCFNNTYQELYCFEKNTVRRRSVDHVIRELKQLKKKENPPFITFDDDTFTIAGKRWQDVFYKRYAEEIGIPFKLNAVATHITQSSAKALKKAGCYAVKIGLESGNDHIRTVLLNKKVSTESIVHAAKILKGHGIRFQTFNILGNPGETFEMAMETYRLNKRIRPHFVWCSLLNPYPGTGIYNYINKNGLFDTEVENQYSGSSYFIDTSIRLDEKHKIVNLQKIMFFAILLKLPDALVKRLVNLPLTKVYNTIFGVGMFVGIIRINRFDLFKTAMLTKKYLVKYNTLGKKRHQ